MIHNKFYIVVCCVLLTIVTGSLTSMSFADTKKTTNPLRELSIYNLNMAKLQTSKKEMEALLNETFNKISEECCENNFEGRERLLEIKDNIEKCLNSSDKKILKIPKCFQKPLLYNPKKKPLKLLLLESVDESKELLLKNSRLKHDNQLIKESNEIAKSKQIAESKKIAEAKKNEDYNKLKEAYDVLEKNNNNLKKRIEVMLKSYDSRIAKLEEDNAKIKEEYSKVYEMLPKYKQKQLQKESKSD